MIPPRATAARFRTALVLLVLAAGLPAWSASCVPQPLPAFDAKPGWSHVPLSKLKRDTAYSVERDGSAAILRATAEGAASAWVHMASADSALTPTLEWRWRVDALVVPADNADPKKEDAPARLIVGFDGDKSKLPDKERRRFSIAKKASGRDMPYATLMYIWENRLPVGTVIPSAHTAQLKMIVVESGPAGLGAWRSYRRDLVEDYRRAFGAAPGRILGVAVMTDTDNTGAKAEARYGPIGFGCPDAAAR
jgi:hypothetical protein